MLCPRLLSLAAPLVILIACSASKDSSFDNNSSSSGSSSGNGGFNPTGTGGNTCEVTDPDGDLDGDGFTPNGGDCNDCVASINPNAAEVISKESTPADENCDGQIDEIISCDQGLNMASSDPMDGARAIELCKTSAGGTDWGVVSARWTRANGNSTSPGLQTGMPSAFGYNILPQGGSSLLVLSSGYARDLNSADGCGSMTCETSGSGTAPANFPQDVPNCEGSTEINDDVALEVTMMAPINAQGYTFAFAFMSFEFPEWVCSSFNDQFIALVSPAPENSINGNISFDSQTNPVSVNIALFDHCDASQSSHFAENCYSGCPSPPSPYCPAGTSFMEGTGFNYWGWDLFGGGYGSGSTGWLLTTAPVTPATEFTIRFAIWDTGDQALDSTVVIDNFQWLGEPGDVVTEPIPDPK